MFLTFEDRGVGFAFVERIWSARSKALTSFCRLWPVIGRWW